MVNNTTSIPNQSTESICNNDTICAIIFIIIVLLWYSSSFVFLMGMQIGISTKIFDDSPKRPTRLFAQSSRNQNNNQEILKELADKQKRDKLWDIYLGTSGDVSDKITRAETLRIRNIEKQLATINKYRQESDERMLDDNFINHSNTDSWSSITDLSSLSSRLRTRRRSSSDQKILQEWKVLAGELKTHESWPWAIQKLFIRRHLRRQRCATECRSAP